MKKWLCILVACVLVLSFPAYVCAQETYSNDYFVAYLADCSIEELLAFQELIREELIRREYEDQVEISWVVNINTDKFHLVTCKSVKDIKDKNRFDYTGSREQLIMLGFEPCGRCHP